MRKKRIISLLLSVFLIMSPMTSFAFDADTSMDASSENAEASQVTEVQTDEQQNSEGDHIPEGGKTPDGDDGLSGSDDTEDDESAVDDTDPGETPADTVAEGDAEQEAEPVQGLNANAPEAEDSDWNAEDFTYDYYSKLMYGCDYTRQLYVSGQIITGFSEQGLAKLDPVYDEETGAITGAKGNTDLVIPAKTPDGEAVTGVGNSAFKGIGLTSVKFPKNMLVPYDDKVTHNITRRGNFIIHESAFSDNKLTKVDLPAGVMACMANSFQRNKITEVTLPRTIWWIETLAFADNQITRVNFPQTCDFRLEMHGMTFAGNKIKSVRLPDYTEVVNKHVFAMNPGMEPMTEDIAKKYSSAGYEKYLEGGPAESGIVYMYTDREALFDAQRIHTLDRPTKNQWSPFQKLVLIGSDNPDPDTEKWTTSDFTYDETTITGFTESGIEKRATHTSLIFPDRTPDGRFVTEIAGSDNYFGGLFGTSTQDSNGNTVVEEGFDTVVLPNGLRKVGDKAFAGIGLKDIVFAPQLQEIGMQAFAKNQIEAALIPDSVKAIGEGAFASNPKLKKITIPQNDQYTKIEGGTFGCSDKYNWMTDLKSIDIPSNITEIGDNAFAGNNFEEIRIPSSVTSIGRYAFSSKNYLKTPATLILPEGLRTIGSRAFRNKKIEKVVIPASLESLPANTFEKVDTDPSSGHGTANPLVTKVYVTTEEQYNDKTNFPDSQYQKIYLSNPEIWTSEDFTFDKVEIGGSSLVAVTGLSEQGIDKVDLNSKVTLPSKDEEGNDVKAVADYAFCADSQSSLHEAGKKLTQVNINENTITHIGAHAFAGNDLIKLELPEGISAIGESAFENSKLTRVAIPASLTMIATNAFKGNKLSAADFTDGGTEALTVSAGAFADNSFRSVQISDNLDVLSGTAFSGNPGMETEEGVVYIYKPTESGSELEYKGNGKSDCQDIKFGQIPAELAPWGPRHFTFSGDTVTGFSEDGELKIKADPYLVLPEKSDDGTVITTIGGVGTKYTDENGEEQTMSTGAFEGYSGNKGTPEEGYKPLIKGVEFPASITTIKMKAFNTCAIEELVLPDTVKVMEPSSFSSNYGMKKIVLSDKMTEVPDGAFVTNATTMDMETGVHEIVIPEGVTRIGRNAFKGQHVRTLSLPDTLVEIDKEAFQNHQISELEIPSSVKKIGERAFEVRQENAVASPSNLILHEGIEEIGSEAFGQTNLESVELPSSLKKLAEDAFLDWKGNGKPDGTKVILRSSIKEQVNGTGEYSGVATESKGHTLMYDSMVNSGWDYDDFTYSDDGTKITGWTDKGNEKRKDYAMRSPYPTMILPDKASYDSDVYITEIADNAFQLQLKKEDGTGGEVTLRKFDADSPYGVQTVIFPEKIKRIGECAFEYNNLQRIDLESYADLTSIGTSAFHGNHLFKVVIPDRINDLGGGAFAMNNIMDLTLSKNVTVIPKGCFSMNIFMYEVSIPDTVTEIDDMAFAGARLEELEIPASVTRIGRKAFHLHHLTSLHIPGNVKTIDESAFEGTFKASTLTKLTMDEGVMYIGKYAFKEALLEEVELPYSLQDMGVDPFYSNKGKDGSRVVYLYSKNKKHLKFNDDKYHGLENGSPKHYHQLEWTGIEPVTVTLDVNGGKALEVTELKSDDRGRLTEALPIPEATDPDKEAFMGWYTEAEGGSEITSESSFARDTTLYAHWTEAPFIIDDVKAEAEADAAKADKCMAAIDSAGTRDEKERAALEAVKAAEKAVASIEKAEKIAQEAVKAAEAADSAASTEESRAKVKAAKEALSSLQSRKAEMSSALASANKTLDGINAEKEAQKRKAEAEKAKADAKIRSVRTVTVNTAKVNATAVNKAVAKAGGSKAYVTKIILGKKVKKISSKAFAGYNKVTTIEIRSKKLKKSSVKKALKGSKVKTVKIKVGSKKVNKKYVKKYKKIFTKKICGRKVKVKL